MRPVHSGKVYHAIQKVSVLRELFHRGCVPGGNALYIPQDVIASSSLRHEIRAFTIFCEERRHPEVSPAVALLRQKPMRPGARDVFARRDPLGTGFVCRVDLFDGLRELGVSGVPPAQVTRLTPSYS